MLTKEQKAEAWRDLSMLEGLPPYDNWSNICYGDGYFAQSLIRKYGMDLSKLRSEIGLNKAAKKYNKAKKLSNSILRNPHA